MTEFLPRLALVTGAAGAMGRRLTARLLTLGWRVRAVVLPGDPFGPELAEQGAEVREADITDGVALRGICDGVDTVYHLAAVIIARDPKLLRRVNTEGTANLLRSARQAGIRHFIYVSSASVTYPRLTPYGKSKLDAERLVRSETRFAHTVVRPTLVYDEHGGQEFSLFLDALRRFPIVPFVGTGRARKRPVWAADVVTGLVGIAGNPRALGKLYNLSGAEAISIRELGHLMLEHHGAARRSFPVPVWLCRLFAWVLSWWVPNPSLTQSSISGIVYDADLDPALAIRELGYRPLGVRAGFQRCFPRCQSASDALPGGREIRAAKGEV